MPTTVRLALCRSRNVLTMATVLTTTVAFARPVPPDQQHATPGTATQNAVLAKEIVQLRSRIAQLELVLDAKKVGSTQPGMAMDEGMGMGGSMAGPKMKAQGMPASGGCCGDMMGKMAAPGSAAATMPSDLPGFAGASHIYHIGATGYFLDHPEAITLTANQQGALNGIKERSIGEQAALQRKIDQAEQELWMLTSSDQPDAMTVETKVREIERLKGDQRIAFVRSVGEAARVLTDEQRGAVLGTSAAPAAPMATPQPSPGAVKPPGGMGDADDDAMGNSGGMGDM